MQTIGVGTGQRTEGHRSFNPKKKKDPKRQKKRNGRSLNDVDGIGKHLLGETESLPANLVVGRLGTSSARGIKAPNTAGLVTIEVSGEVQ